MFIFLRTIYRCQITQVLNNRFCSTIMLKIRGNCQDFVCPINIVSRLYIYIYIYIKIYYCLVYLHYFPTSSGNNILNNHVNFVSKNTNEYFWNLVKTNRNQIGFTIFWLIISNQTDIRLVPNLSENDKYDRIFLVWFNKIPKIFLCV